MLARTKARTANIEVEFHLPDGSQRLQIQEDTARLLLAVMAKMLPGAAQGAAEDEDGPVDAMAFVKGVEKRAGGPVALAMRAYRNRLGLSQAEVAKAAGMQASHISAMESGTRKVTPKMAKRLAEVLECDWRKLV